jgi:hypothetical protein
VIDIEELKASIRQDVRSITKDFLGRMMDSLPKNMVEAEWPQVTS